MMKAFFTSDLVLLTITIALFVAGSALHRRTRLMLLHPVLLTFVAVIVFLRMVDIPYDRYMEATHILDFALGLSVVSLGYLLYEQSERLSRNLLPILCSTLAGCVAGVLSVVWIAAWLGADRTILNSIAPKSVTVPIAITIAEPMGGIISITSVVVFCVGIFGAVFGPQILHYGGVCTPESVGFSLGAASHGIGTSRAIELGAIEGAMSGLAMALMGVATALLTPILGQYFY
ncbi:MAG: LrgB family protein [Alistipes sp.]|nr:LrgB family protein [Alistipes sp.]